MTLRRLHERLGEIIEQNDRRHAANVKSGNARGYDAINRNEREVMVEVRRGGRKRSWHYPIKFVSSALCGVTFESSQGPVRQDILEVCVDESELMKPYSRRSTKV